jgi:O-antigen ligase
MAFIFLFIFSALLGLTALPWLYLSVAALFIVILHLLRSDIELIKKTQLNIPLLMLVEYLMLSIPFLIMGIVQQKTVHVLIYVIFLVCIPYLIPPGIYVSHKFNPTKKNTPYILK